MRHKFLFVLVYLLFMLLGFSQPVDEVRKHGHSLYQQLQRIENQDQKAQALFDLSFFWSDYDSTNAFRYIQEALDVLGPKGNSTYYQGVKSFYQAAVYFGYNPSIAKQHYIEAEKYFKNVNGDRRDDASRYRARGWASYGALLQREGRAADYVDILMERVIPLAESIQDSSLLGNNYQNIALNLMNLGDYRKADIYYDKALFFLGAISGAAEERLTLFVNRSRNAILAKNYTRSEQYLDSASFVLHQIPNSIYIPVFHAVSGSHWTAVKNYKRAHEHFEEGLKIARRQGNDDMVATLLFDQFTAYQSRAQYAAAKEKLLEVLPYVEQKSSLRNKQMVYHNLASTTSKLQQYQEAVNWYEAYKKVTDTLDADQHDTHILELEEKYQAAEKEKALLQAKTENQYQQLSLQRTRTILGILLLIIIVLTVISYVWFTSLKQKKVLAEQKEKLLNEELNSQRQQEKLNVYHAMLQGQEHERSRIARDLHDGLGGMLASVKLKLSAVATTINQHEIKGQSHMELYTIINQLDHSVNELRRVARNMMPESLLYMGLEAALQDLCNAMCNSDLKIDFQSSNLSKHYPQAFQIAVYRMVQELLTNAVKHSGGTQVWVQCREEDEKFFISVEDNGKGFDLNHDSFGKQGVGISNIRNRVEILNGELEIDTSLGRGTSFHIQIAINE